MSHLSLQDLTASAATLRTQAHTMRQQAEALREQHQDSPFPLKGVASELHLALHQAARENDAAARIQARAALLLSLLETGISGPRNFEEFDAAKLEQLEGLYEWRGKEPIPQVGSRINVTMNGLGPGTVRAYFLAGDPGSANSDHPHRRFLGVAVDLEQPPRWYVEQNKDRPKNEPAYLFGAEVAPL